MIWQLWSTEPPGTSINQVGNKFYEAFQQKHGSYADLPAAKITELMKSSSLDVNSLSIFIIFKYI
jgi:hypothetical protein